MFNISLPNLKVLKIISGALLFVFLLAWLRLRPLCVIFLALWGFWLYWTCGSYRLAPTIELQTKIESTARLIAHWRRERPKAWCAIATVGCVIMAIIGQQLSSSTAWLIGLSVAILLVTKLKFQIVPVEPTNPNDNAAIIAARQENELYAEFLPDVNEMNLGVLERASNFSTLSYHTDVEDDEDKSEEIPSELLIHDTIPEIDEHSSEDDDELVPILPVPTHLTTSQLTHTHMQNDNDNGLNFHKDHFKSVDTPLSTLSISSSSSEESLSKGLQFPDHNTIDGRKRQQRAIMPSMDVLPPLTNTSSIIRTQTQSLLSDLVTGIVQWSTNVGTVTPTTPTQVFNTIDSSEEDSDVYE